MNDYYPHDYDDRDSYEIARDAGNLRAWARGTFTDDEINEIVAKAEAEGYRQRVLFTQSGKPVLLPTGQVE